MPMAAFDRDTTIAQKIVDSGLSGLQLTDALYGAYAQLPDHQRQAFLNTRVTATVWHGTRRRESIEELKRNGFCSYTQEQAIRWLDEAHRRLSAKIKPGPRVTKSLEKWKAMVRGHVKEPWRGYLCVTAIEDAACGEQAHNPFTGRPDSGNLMSGWADRNPEFVYDYLMLRATPQELDRILTEMFGRPIKVKLRVSVEVRTLLNPQDMHLKQRCFSPAEIIDITPCPPKTARQLKTEVDVLWAPQVERKTHFAAGAKYAPRGRQAHDQGG